MAETNKHQETKAKGTFGKRLKTDFSANWQRYCLAAIVVAFSLFMLIGIGNFSMPDSYYQFRKKYDESGAQIDNEVVLRLNYNLDASGNPVMLDNVWVYFGSSNMKGSAVAQMKFSYGLSATTSNWLSAEMGTIKTKDSWGAKDSSADDGDPDYKKTIYRMYKWTQLFGDLDLPNKSYQFIRITTKNPVYIHELVFRDKNDDLMQVEVVSGDASAAKMFDEQDKFTTVNTRFNSIIFDEYYFARTAFDFLRGDACYQESSHPPLGKIILAAGIGIFGMNTFGMRVMPALFSIATIFVIYAIGKRLFGKNNRSMGVLFALLFAISGINISLGRIGTTDAFLTFFVALSYYYMLIFLQNGIDRNHRLLSFVPLLLSGIFFGFGAAVKWSGITAGIGLFLLFACFFFVRLFAGIGKVKRLSSGMAKEEKVTFLTRVKALWGAKEEEAPALSGLSAEETARTSDPDPEAAGKAVAKKEQKALTCDLLLSVLFAGVGFLVFAFIIYLLSYLVAGNSYCALYETNSPLKAFLENQKYIWSFHTSNFGTDDNSSPWWGWPIGYKAACFYTEYTNPKMHVRILCNATLLLYLFTFVSFLYLTLEVATTVFNKNAGEADISYVKRVLRPYVYLLIAFLGCYLPWAFVKRPMYTYTFLPPSIFYVGFLVLFLYAALNEWKRFGKKILIGVLIVCGLNFITSYPSYAGVPLPKLMALIFYGWTNLNPGTFLRPNMGALRFLSGIFR